MKLIRSGILYTMAGEPIRDGELLIGDDGKIAAVGRDLAAPADAERFDFSGMTVTPGLIDAHAHIAGFGIKDGDASNDTADPVCPQLRIIDGINPHHESFARTRLGGFTSCCLLPGSANIIGGQGVMYKLLPTDDPEKNVFGPLQIKMALGENPRRSYGEEKGRSPMTRMGNAFLLKDAMRSAHAYYDRKINGENPPYHEKWEAMLPLFSGEAVAHIHCHRMDDILMAMRVMEAHGVRFSIDHCTDGHLVSEILSAHGVSCIVGPISCGPQKQETWHCTPACAGVLEKAGVENVALTLDADTHVCALPLDVGIAVAFGLSHEGGLKAITSAPAKICGVFDRVGSLEPGKDADIAVFTGDPLSNRSLCRGTFINGQYFAVEEAY